MTENNLDSWDGLLTNFFKAEVVPGDEGTEAAIVCVGVKKNEDTLDLDVDFNEKRYLFSLNKTNMVFLKENGIDSPKQIVGKKITVRKTSAMNPTLRKEVPTLRISKVE